MAQFLNTNVIDLKHLNPVLSWKGKTITQITSLIKKNPGKFSISTNNTRSLFLPNPLKIYRKEIANPIELSNCYSRSSLRINELNYPNGSINNTSISSKINGLVNTLENKVPYNSCEEPGTCLTFLSTSENAKRRCRSSGIIKKAYNPANNCSNYYTDSKQYLVSRNKTFLQNQYNFIRVGNSSLTPSSGLAASNIYSPNGRPVCPKYFIPTNCTFSYQWLDSLYYNVSVQSGYYDANDFNGILQNAMSSNYHFLINNTTGSKVFLIAIIYDDVNNVIQFQFTCYDRSNFPSNNYSSDIRADSLWTNYGSGTSISSPAKGQGVVTILRFSNNSLFNALGISSGTFPLNIPSSPINVTGGSWSWSNYVSNYTSNQVINSSLDPGLKSVYNKIYYKPNNPQFGQQGAVSSSSLINRIKIDTINTAATNTNGNIFDSKVKKAYGINIGNALAYGVSENPYTMKDKIGYPNISYPSFLPGSKDQRKCIEKSIPGGA